MKSTFLLFLCLAGAGIEPVIQGGSVAADGGSPSAVTSKKPGDAGATPPRAIMPDLGGEGLAPSSTTYEQVFEMAGRKIDGKLVRNISQDQINGRSAWKVVDSLTTAMGVAHDELWIDPQNLLPIKRAAKQGPATIDLVVGEKLISGERKMGTQQMPVHVKIDGPTLLDGASLEVALAGLPLTADYKTKLRALNSMTTALQTWTVEVAGRETLNVKDKQFDSFKVKLASADDGNSATLWIEASVPHRVIKGEASLVTPGGTGRVTKVIQPSP